MMNSILQNWMSGFGLRTGSAARRGRRDARRWGFASERLEERALLSASPVGPVAAEVKHAKGTKAASLPNIAGDWLLTGIAVNGAFNDASLTITQSGKTGKVIAGTANFTGGSFTFTGKLRPNGHMTGKANIQLGETTLPKQRYFADFTDDFLTFSGEVNLKSLDDLMNIDGVRAV